MADQNVHFLSALVKLRILGGDYRSHPDFQALPNERNDSSWDMIKAGYGLEVLELTALKNVRCATLSQPPQAGTY